MIKLAGETVESIFYRFEDTLPGYEYRPQQLEFAKAIERAIETRVPGIFEAGTGTGKSLAALIPAALSGKKVVVSTATIALQEQYINKDIPTLQSVLPFRIEAALAKGRNNYIGLRRFEDHKLQSEVDPRILSWLADSEEGDRSELEFVPLSEQWNEISSDSDDCLRSKCARYQQCYYFRARKRAEDADIIVVNHSLLLIDAASGGNILPKYNVLIVDEAHQLPEVATKSFSLSITPRSVQYLSSRCTKHLGTPGFMVHGLEELAQEFFHRLGQCISFGKTRLRKAPDGTEELTESLLELRDWLTSQEFEQVIDIDNKREKLKLKAKSLASTATGFIRCLDLLTHQEPSWVFWAEKSDGGGRMEITAAPLNVSQMLSDTIFNKDELETSIWMSATLATNGEDPFAFFKKEIGAPSRIIQERVSSPFDYRRQAVLYLPSRVPDPNSGDFVHAIADHIEEILQLSRGRAFLLFTSYNGMNNAFNALQDRLTYPCQKQGDMPRKRLIEWFRETPGAVLFATNTFWEGVSIDGEQLSCVIIDRIPFQAPDDPVYEARCELMKEDEGAGRFGSLALPRAIMRLKQGTGRLIRTRSDRGIVAILDPRMTQKMYGRSIIACLPPMKLVKSLGDSSCIDDLIDT